MYNLQKKTPCPIKFESDNSPTSDTSQGYIECICKVMNFTDHEKRKCNLTLKTFSRSSIFKQNWSWIRWSCVINISSDIKLYTENVANYYKCQMTLKIQIKVIHDQ